VLLIAAAVVLMLIFSSWSRRTVPPVDPVARPTGRKLRKKLK